MLARLGTRVFSGELVGGAGGGDDRVVRAEGGELSDARVPECSVRGDRGVSVAGVRGCRGVAGVDVAEDEGRWTRGAVEALVLQAAVVHEADAPVVPSAGGVSIGLDPGAMRVDGGEVHANKAYRSLAANVDLN